MIISNPPFYIVSKLLSSDGLFTTIIPFKEEQAFIQLAASFGLFPSKILRVKGNPTSEIKRSLIEFCFKEAVVSEDELIIEIKRHEYTLAYQELTKAFYLKM